MAGKRLLDSSVLVPFFRGDPAIRTRMGDERFLLPCIAVGELLVGQKGSSFPRATNQRVEGFLTRVDVLSCDLGTAYEYATVKCELRQRGTPIPENDVWIAALAIQHDLTLAMRDAHFESVSRLKAERW